MEETNKGYGFEEEHADELDDLAEDLLDETWVRRNLTERPTKKTLPEGWWPGDGE